MMVRMGVANKDALELSQHLPCILRLCRVRPESAHELAKRALARIEQNIPALGNFEQNARHCGIACIKS